jgi:hypothetical protein
MQMVAKSFKRLLATIMHAIADSLRPAQRESKRAREGITGLSKIEQRTDRHTDFIKRKKVNVPHGNPCPSCHLRPESRPHWVLSAKFEGELAERTQSYSGVGKVTYSW